MKRIAVIDDRTDTLQVISIFLGAPDVKVEAFTDPLLFLDKLQSDEFDLVITDISMPGMDGHELCRRIHTIDPALPAIALTGSVFPEDHSKALTSGFAAYVDKPIADWDAFIALAQKTSRDR